ncbi:glucose-6-phosphate exchanger SLC37A2-like isoform X1 [Asterias rubens]|uniref:glucose-6-phosphate exchanger SLC37A2-like isoform X1 n=1 Tax=Asterias rubens TaxID=7604 RepID=UPI0014550AD1|nr:glucose-6-phosphate exchanger SLC37A2-like isoform X1 [Asterias rubens]XP_033641155.1 glucose-6-phosphate exchanger SLC37A2-like isoform X1 [Asterias rubens]
MAPLPIMAPLFDACFRGKHHKLLHKSFVLILTFFTYMTYHLSRRPISIAKGVWFRNCSVPINDLMFPILNISEAGNEYWCDWAPFDTQDAKVLLGWLDTSYLFAYAVGMFISGHIAERMSLRYFLTGGMILSGIFTAAVGLAEFFNIHSYAYFISMMILGGFFQATGWPAVVAVVANWYGKGKRGSIMGIWNVHTSLGNILGALVAGALIDETWAFSFIVPGCIIAGMGVIVFLFLIEYPTDIGCDTPEQSSSPKELDYSSSRGSGRDDVAADHDHSLVLSEQPAVSLWVATTIPGVIEFSLSLFFCKLVSYTFLFWLPFYIDSTTDLNDAQSADLSTLFDVGGVLGGIVIGFLSDVTGASATVSFVALIISAPLVYIYNAFGYINLASSIGLMMVTAFFTNAPYALITTAVSADLGTHPSLHGNAKALATVASIIDGTGTIGAAIGPLLTGLINPGRGEKDWTWVFVMLAASELLSAMFLIRLVYRDIKKCACSNGYQPISTDSNINGDTSVGISDDKDEEE